MSDLTILNLGAGRIKPLTNINYGYIVNVDRGFPLEVCSCDTESCFRKILKGNLIEKLYINYDIFEYLEKTLIEFNYVCLYRILEHIPFTKVDYFIYLISRVIKKKGIVDIIVPDINKLSSLTLEKLQTANDNDFRFWHTLLTTEIVNEPFDPHASIWNPTLLKYFWELEKRFKLVELEENYLFDDRDIYIRCKMERI